MKWMYKVIIIVVIAFIIGLALLFFLPQYKEIISIAAALITIFSLIFIFYPSREKNYIQQLENMIREYNEEKTALKREQEAQKGEIKKVEEKYETEKQRTLHLSILVENIGIALEREHISKQELIENIESPLKALVFFKTWEDTDRKRELFIKKVYPDMHVYGIRSGLSIIPPKYVPQDISNEKIIDWFKTEVEKKIPSDYQYNIPFITIVDLTDIKYFNKLDSEKKRGDFTYLRHIPPEELIPSQLVINFLARKMKLSVKDIIEIPNLLFLIDDNNITIEDKTKIIHNKNKINDEIKNYLKVKEFNTTDLANIDETEFTLILSKFGVKYPSIIVQMIKHNAKIWKLIFERQVSAR